MLYASERPQVDRWTSPGAQEEIQLLETDGFLGESTDGPVVDVLCPWLTIRLGVGNNVQPGKTATALGKLHELDSLYVHTRMELHAYVSELRERGQASENRGVAEGV